MKYFDADIAFIAVELCLMLALALILFFDERKERKLRAAPPASEKGKSRSGPCWAKKLEGAK